MRTVENVDAANDLVQSQEDHPHSHLTVRQISHELEIPKSCVHDVIKQDLKLKCLKRKRAQELTEANKVARYELSKQLLRKYRQHAVDFVWFSDEKLFTIAAPRNAQNDRIYVHSTVKKRDVAGPRLLRTRPTFSQSIMVTVAVCPLGCTTIHFLESDVKINGEYYRNNVLCHMLLPEIRRVSGDWYIFQQESVREHIVDRDDLKHRLKTEWANLDHAIIAAAIRQWRRRLSVCVRAGSGHFEHCF